jgi:hypothetical protein
MVSGGFYGLEMCTKWQSLNSLIFFCAVCMAAILFEDVWSGGGDTRSSKSTQKKQIKNIYKTQELLIAV